MHLSARATADHPVRFYADDTALMAPLCGFISDGLARGDSALLLLLPSHLAAVRSGIEAAAGSRALDSVRFLDAEALADALGGAGVTEESFARLAGPQLDWALSRSRGGGVSVYGEVVDALWRRGQEGEALALEGVWEGALRRMPLRLMCGHRMDLFDARCSVLAERHDLVLPQPEQRGTLRRLETALSCILGDQTQMVRLMVTEEPRLRELPFAQAALIWLGGHAPVLAGRVRALARAQGS